MPRWLSRMLRTTCIGIGAAMIISAIVNGLAINQLFDASVEEQLGVTRQEMYSAYVGVGGFGLLIVLAATFWPAKKKAAPQARESKRLAPK